MGGPGPDLILPPDYKGDLNPPGGGAEAEVNGQKYFVARSGGYGNWLILRGFLVDGKPDDATAMFKNGLKVYPLVLAGKAPAMKFISASRKVFNTIHANNYEFCSNNYSAANCRCKFTQVLSRNIPPTFSRPPMQRWREARRH